MNDIQIVSLRGGMDDTDTPTVIAEDQCVLAENVEFFHSMLGERRRGCESFLSAADVATLGLTTHIPVAMTQWFPTNDATAPEFWAVFAIPAGAVVVGKRTAGTWSVVTPDDAIVTTAPNIYNISFQSLNGKLFIAYPSAQDRLHVWDGTNLRRTGLAQSAAPTGADQGVGTFSGTRYYRVRYVIKSGSTILVRSEPSAVLTFVPSGVGAGVTVTKPAAISEHETHWELEASTDNVTFYRIASTVVGTTTFIDTIAFAVGYAAGGTLSDAIGAYTLEKSVRFLSVDLARLLYAGHFTDASLKSTIGWTPVPNDPGVGNDERAPIVTTGGAAINTTLALDNYDGGSITGISAASNGLWWAFKWSRIYRQIHTGDPATAYDSKAILGQEKGALSGSIVSGVDEVGQDCVYFADPVFGPSRAGVNGVQTIRGLRTTWRRVNTLATKVISRALYYPDKQQVHWWFAADANDSPTLKFVLQTTSQRFEGEGYTRGWSTATGVIAQAYSVCNFSEQVSNDPSPLITLRSRPFIGLATTNYIQRCDTGPTDNGTTFKARIKTRPYMIVGILNKWGVLVAGLLAASNSGRSLIVRIIRDFGVETASITTTLQPAASEDLVFKTFDALHMSEAKSIQIEFTEP